MLYETRRSPSQNGVAAVNGYSLLGDPASETELASAGCLCISRGTNHYVCVIVSPEARNVGRLASSSSLVKETSTRRVARL
jgi:hypothetical protein